MRRRKFPVYNIVIPMIVGGAVAAVVYYVNGDTLNRANLPSDVLFAMASAVLIWAIIRSLGNLRMFTSFTFGFRQLHALIAGKQKKSAEMKEAYLAYRESRPVHENTWMLFAAGAVLLILSLAVTLI